MARQLGIIVVGGEGNPKKRPMMSTVAVGLLHRPHVEHRRRDCQLGIGNGLIQRTGVCQLDQVVVADHDQRGRGDERQIGGDRRLGCEQLEPLRHDLAEVMANVRRSWPRSW